MKRFGFFTIAALVAGLLVTSCGSQDMNAALLKAAEDGDAGKVATLFNKGADLNSMDDFERTPLMIASLKGHSEFVDSLIEAGADTYAEAKFGQTALSFAAEQGHTAIVDAIKAAQLLNPEQETE